MLLASRVFRWREAEEEEKKERKTWEMGRNDDAVHGDGEDSLFASSFYSGKPRTKEWWFEEFRENTFKKKIEISYKHDVF